MANSHLPNCHPDITPTVRTLITPGSVSNKLLLLGLFTDSRGAMRALRDRIGVLYVCVFIITSFLTVEFTLIMFR